MKFVPERIEALRAMTGSPLVYRPTLLGERHPPTPLHDQLDLIEKKIGMPSSRTHPNSRFQSRLVGERLRMIEAHLAQTGILEKQE